jgi:hypothetical protein
MPALAPTESSGQRAPCFGPIPAQMSRNWPKTRGFGGPANRRDNPASKPNSGLGIAWIAPRRSPVRVRLAPLGEPLQMGKRNSRLPAIAARYCGVMTRKNVTTVQLAVAALNNRDVDAYLACCVDDVELQTPVSPVEGAYRGTTGIRRTQSRFGKTAAHSRKWVPERLSTTRSHRSASAGQRRWPFFGAHP